MKQHFMTFLLVLAAVLCPGTALTAQEAVLFGSDRLSSSLITAIGQTPDGWLWVGTENGLNRFDGYRFTPVELPAGAMERPVSITQLCTDASGLLWVGTTRGALRQDRQTGTFLPINFPYGLGPRITSLREQPDGTMAAGTAGYGIFLIDAATLLAIPSTGVIPEGDEAFAPDLKVAPHLTDKAPAGTILTCTAEDCSGTAYLGTRGSGLYRLARGASEAERMEVQVAGLDLARARVEALFVDKGDNLWVGCRQKGLLMVPPHGRRRFEAWSFGLQGHQTGTAVAAIAARTTPESQGAAEPVWCTVQGDGVYGFSAQGHLLAHPTAPAGVEALCCDSRGQFWLGTTDGLWAYDPTSGSARLLLSTGGHTVNLVHELPDSRLAVSAFGDGLYLFDTTRAYATEHLTMHDTLPDGRGQLANDWVFAMDHDAQGRLWISTSCGVCCYDPATRSFATLGWLLLMPQEQVTALCVLRSGEVLMAGEVGLYRWSPAQGLKPESGTAADEKGKDQLHGRRVCYMTEDARGDIWMSTSDGIWQWNPRERRLVGYVGTSEFGQREFALGAGWQDAQGRLYFGTADGITCCCPDSLRSYRPAAAHVHLTALLIQGEQAGVLSRSGHRRVMQQPVEESHEFCLSHADATLRMEFSLLDFAAPEGVAYSYRMSGDDRWHQTREGENALTFSHLAPGRYELEVRALRSGVFTPAERYIITVRPPWWNSTAAWVAYVLLLLMAAAAVAIAYQRHLRHQMDREKLHLLMSAINREDTPLSLDDMKRAISSFVQSRREQRATYGNASHVLDQMETPEVRGNDEALMERVIQSVNNHLDDSEFSVEQMCEEVGISRAHLHRKMKELTGMPTTEFIRNIRLEQAARLLKERKLNITQVAYSVGFSNLSYFSTVFRKHFGVKPTEFIEQNT